MKLLFSYALAILCVMGSIAVSARVEAQGMSPVIQEFNKKARGTVEVTNIGDAPKMVSCKAQGFDPNEHGAPMLRDLDAALHVRIDSERVLLAPRGTRQVSFDADPASLPAWFAITCRFMPIDQTAGFTLAMEITSMVIVHGGSFDVRDVALSAKRVGNKVEVEVKNNGSGLTRVSSGAVLGHKKLADLGNFLLYPHQRRTVEAELSETASPEAVRIQIGKKRLQAPVN